MNKRRTLYLIACSAVLASACTGLSACGSDAKPELKAGDALRLVDGVELDYGNAIFDGFDSGVDSKRWYIGKQAWGAGGNGGVVPENVNYTDDGMLVITGNGKYYTEGKINGVGAYKDGSLTGGALISKFVTGPGRYEIKMKALPRLGACSAFWTFAYDQKTLGNHEIDIEFPGGTHSGGGDNIGFDRILNTNYWTNDLNVSQDTLISEATGGKTAAVNDGQWHTFGFDWYTVEPGEDEYEKADANTRTDSDGYILDQSGERTGDRVDDDGYIVNESGKRQRVESVGKVIYYMDGIVTAVNDVYVPYYMCRLWLGVWFPNNTGFVGDADFETDNMYVDYVSYVPFKGQPCTLFNPVVSGYADISEYPDKPVSVADINKTANGDFEYIMRGSENSGWVKSTAPYSESDYALAEAEFERQYREGNAAAIEDRAFKAAFAAAHAELEGEELDAAYDEYKNSDGFSADLETFRNGDGYEEAIDAAFGEIKKERDYIRALRAFVYPVDAPVHEERGIGVNGTCGVRLENCGMLYQTVDSVYSGYRVDISAAVRGKGTVYVRFLSNYGGSDYLKEYKIDVDSEEWKEAAGSFEAPDGSRYVQIRFTSFYGSELFIDDVSAEVK